MKREIPERFLWAVEKIDLKKGDKVLEVGFGAGILIDLMAQHPVMVHISGIDKSRAMVSSALKKNQVHINDGRVSLLHADISTATFTHKFSKIVAFNVPFFRAASPSEMPYIHKLLAPKGMLLVFYQTPSPIGKTDLEKIVSNLQPFFTIVSSEIKKLKESTVLCVCCRHK